MSPETRSSVMARIKGKDTGPELALGAALAEQGVTWEAHARDLPGKPDFVFRAQCVAVFVDGEFWHGRKFHEWRDKLSEAWEAKIAANRRRDARNRRQLREAGWTVIRFWEREIKNGPARCARRVVRALQECGAAAKEPGQFRGNLVSGNDEPEDG